MGECHGEGQDGPGKGVCVSSVYVHAPFCSRRCIYCDFAVTVARGGDLEGWLAALAAELRNLEEEGLCHLAPLLDTVFVGGGTPSTLGPRAMAGLARLLGSRRLQGPALAWTVEANPASVTSQVAEAWAAAGVNRISLGAQSFQEGPLRWMGRLHGARGTAEAVDRARKVGMANVSLDLIFGFPVEVERDWGWDLQSALSLEVPHLSLYGLSVEPGTPLGSRVAEGGVSPVEENRYREEFLEASHRLTEAGYRQYELSNFRVPAQPGVLGPPALSWVGQRGPFLSASPPQMEPPGVAGIPPCGPVGSGGPGRGGTAWGWGDPNGADLAGPPYGGGAGPGGALPRRSGKGGGMGGPGVGGAGRRASEAPAGGMAPSGPPDGSARPGGERCRPEP